MRSFQDRRLEQDCPRRINIGTAKERELEDSIFFVFFSFFRLTERTDKLFSGDSQNRRKMAKESLAEKWGVERLRRFFGRAFRPHKSRRRAPCQPPPTPCKLGACQICLAFDFGWEQSPAHIGRNV